MYVLFCSHTRSRLGMEWVVLNEIPEEVVVLDDNTDDNILEDSVELADAKLERSAYTEKSNLQV